MYQIWELGVLPRGLQSSHEACRRDLVHHWSLAGGSVRQIWGKGRTGKVHPFPGFMDGRKRGKIVRRKSTWHGIPKIHYPSSDMDREREHPTSSRWYQRQKALPKEVVGTGGQEPWKNLGREARQGRVPNRANTQGSAVRVPGRTRAK